MNTTHNMRLFVAEKDKAEHARRSERALDLRRSRRKGIPDPALGRIPRGADIAEAEALVNALVQVVVK